MTYRIERPKGRRRPVVVEIPHAGLGLDAESAVWSIAPLRSVARDADLYVDRLYGDAPELGATLFVAEFSRYVCDLNRAEGDVDRLSVLGGQGENAPHGFIWRRTSDGDAALASPLSPLEQERRRDNFYRPYHAALNALLTDIRSEFGFAILLCAHSMPSRGKPGTLDAGRARADVVPGTRGKTTCAESVTAIPETIANQFGWSLRHDHPYRGGHTTAYYGRPTLGWHAMQIELSRGLYMDELSLSPNQGMQHTRQFCAELVAALAKLESP
ncbi:MAG TPA: N-formylglutamate amidohydrolase [Polyangiaceae bacterium]|nr:N-formylglutamate amidohydrolase [Polyangiaceae bacterium]